MQEVEKGSGIGRSELFSLSHTKKDGTPVNEKAGEAIVSTSVLLVYVSMVLQSLYIKLL
jgi:hypothetical protein